MLPVALDAMGGDRGPEVNIAGALRAQRAGIPVLLVGDETKIRQPRKGALPVLHARESVEMGESAAKSVRAKPGSSIRAAIDAIKNGQACAAVSCGNTGAFMAAATLVLGRIEGVDRPAITTLVPRTDGGRLVVLDLGANTDPKPEHLAQFARLGDAFARVVLELDRPRIGLLSNGEEPSKGNDLVRAAHALLKELPLEFVGNVEPPHAFHGACDVLVCDGFVGNVMLKSIEATAEVVGGILRREILAHPSSRFGAWLLRGALSRVRKRTAYSSIGGALLLGVDGVVVVAHGRSDATAVAGAIAHAHRCARDDLVARVRTALRPA
jgi:glycerol-3-phosphate acyltransferase PlsX